MLSFPLVYSSQYYLPLGTHVFPGEKYRLIHDRLLSTGIAEDSDFVAPAPATNDDVLRVHTPEYVEKLLTGTLSYSEQMLLEIPFSREVREGFWLMAGGSILAARLALERNIAFNIGGGFHHAYPDHGEGFCMIHDVAIAIRRMQHDGRIQRAMVLDCDVHHGNGTAAIFPPKQPMTTLPSAAKHAPSNSDTDVFTISLHQQNNYPAIKPPSSIDVNLPDGIGDEQYLGWLEQALSSGLRNFNPDLLCYIAGADPYREDQLGGLRLTINGLQQRDSLVFRVARSKNIPIMVTYAGGYARAVQDTVTIHCNTVAAAAEQNSDFRAA
ncbi:MAG TPA: histone deacetylase [Terriglobales bacterium]|jgi:acetoin utilization deacetylase AcuC-like enzyme